MLHLNSAWQWLLSIQRVWGSFYKNALYKFTVIITVIKEEGQDILKPRCMWITQQSGLLKVDTVLYLSDFVSTLAYPELDISL